MVNWFRQSIRTDQELYDMVDAFDADREFIIAGAFDTETDGLHIIYSTPFLFQFGWITETHGRAYSVDLERNPELARRTITIWHTLCRTLEHYLGANVKFDLHMLKNIGLPYSNTNITDLQIYIRLGTDAIQEEKGGAPLALKKFAAKYVDAGAKKFESEIDEARSKMASMYNRRLCAALGVTKKYIDTFFKDKLNTYEDLPEQLVPKYKIWHSDLPIWLQQKVTGLVDKDFIQYNKLDRDMVEQYAQYDIVYTLESFKLLKPIVELRGNQIGVQLENDTLEILVDMERVGFYIDYDYLLESKARLKEYILERRKDLCRYAGQDIKSSQSKELIRILNDMDVSTESTGKEVLSKLKASLHLNVDFANAVDLIDTVQELRTLEKWYSTYIIRFIQNYRESDGRLYTTIHSTGPVSGRVSSDFQQFPKGGIKSIDGRELFTPRRMVIVPPNSDYESIVYLDYSQIELRFQSLYTVLLGAPDLNLCRAYMPYKCVRYTESGDLVTFDTTKHWDIEHAYDIDWFLEEDVTKKWTPTDVHGATTKAAFDITEADKNYHDLRYVGKRVNFAKNYGAQYGKIREMFPEFTDEQCEKINDAYYKAFPGIKIYQDYCYKLAKCQAYATNMFGVRYYNVSGHNLINMLIQGSAAYFLKWKEVEVVRFMKAHNMKSKYMMQIHDELQFLKHKDDDPALFFEIKKIMESWDDTQVPIVADMEVTMHTWKNKYEVNNLEEFYGRAV